MLLKRISAALFHQLVHWMRQSREREKPALRGEERGSDNVGETSGTQMERAREDLTETQGLRGLYLPENQTWNENKLKLGFPLFTGLSLGKSPTEFKLEQSQLQSQLEPNQKKE